MDSVYIIPISRSIPTKLRIENASGGGYYLWKLITRATNPALLDKPVISNATEVSATEFTTNWTPVSNATGYNIFVYTGITLVDGAPFAVIGQTASSYNVTGLTPENDYTYKVQAAGDGDVNYSDSFVSLSSETITTLADLGTGTDKIGLNHEIIVNDKTIIAPESGNLAVYSLQGLQIFKADNTIRVNTNLPAGMYVVRFINKMGKQTTQKISIK